MGYTTKGLKPCLHPLLAVLAEVRLVAQLWLRPGNASCGNNAAAFFLDLWENLPRRLRLRAVRADSGFCLPELLALWEQLRLPYVVVAQLSVPIKNLLRRGLEWRATEVPGNRGGRDRISGAALAAPAPSGAGAAPRARGRRARR